MAHVQSALSELLTSFQNGEEVDLVRESVRIVLQELIDTEAIAVIGADRYQRTPNRVTERNGTRPREVMTKAGTVEVNIPKLRSGSFFPSVGAGAAPPNRPSLVRGGDGSVGTRGVDPQRRRAGRRARRDRDQQE